MFTFQHSLHHHRTTPKPHWEITWSLFEGDSTYQTSCRHLPSECCATHPTIFPAPKAPNASVLQPPRLIRSEWEYSLYWNAESREKVQRSTSRHSLYLDTVCILERYRFPGERLHGRNRQGNQARSGRLNSNTD